jgi:hypothetical protein
VRKSLKALHAFIILNLLVQILYGFYMVFYAVGGEHFPLFRRAIETPIEIILRRRLYAVETWLAIVGLCIYLAITEILPQKLREDWRPNLADTDSPRQHESGSEQESALARQSDGADHQL